MQQLLQLAIELFELEAHDRHSLTLRDRQEAADFIKWLQTRNWNFPAPFSSMSPDSPILQPFIVPFVKVVISHPSASTSTVARHSLSRDHASLGRSVGDLTSGNNRLSTTAKHSLAVHHRKLARIPLSAVILNAQKVVPTSAYLQAKREVHSVTALDRLESMKRAAVVSSSGDGEAKEVDEIYSLIQPRKFVYKRVKTHWDHLLDGMQALSVDFQEERRWRVAMALFFAMQCAHHVNSRGGVSVVDGGDISLTLTLAPSSAEPVYCIQPPPAAGGDAGPLVGCELVDSYAVVPTVNCFQSAVPAFADSDSYPIAKVLNDERRYFSTLSSVFSFDFATKNPFVPAHPPNIQVRAPVTWTPEEDDLLMKCTPLTSQNWTLLAEILASSSSCSSTTRRNKLGWDCYSRYQVLAAKLAGSSSVSQTSSMGMGLVGMLAFGKLSSRRDDRRRAGRHAQFFDGVMKIIKKRDGAKKGKGKDEEESAAGDSTNDKMDTTPSVEKKAAPTTHASHAVILQRAGFDGKQQRGVAEHAERRLQLLKMAQQRPQHATATASRPPNLIGTQTANAVRTASPLPPSPRPPLAPARPQMTMSQAQVQQFIQRQNMLRQFPNMQAQQAAGMMNMQRFMYRPPAGRGQGGQPNNLVPGTNTGARITPEMRANLEEVQKGTTPQQQQKMLTPEMMQAMEEAKKNQAAILNNIHQQQQMQRASSTLNSQASQINSVRGAQAADTAAEAVATRSPQKQAKTPKRGKKNDNN